MSMSFVYFLQMLRYCCVREQGAGSGQLSLDIKPEVHDIAFLNDVFLAFEA
jgi:hypothetical protein